MSNDAVACRCRIKFERHHMDFMAAPHQLAGKLPRPMLQPAARRIETFENQADFQAKGLTIRCTGLTDGQADFLLDADGVIGVADLRSDGRWRGAPVELNQAEV